MSGDKLKILCVEDNPMNWRLVQRLLSQAGYEMHWADDGLKGCEMALALRPALILLDINLPGLSGFEVATKLRQSRDMDGTLIVALTAKTMRVDRETALVTGCDGFIPKPIDPFLFVGQVEAYLGGQRDRLDQDREGAVLRQFSLQVVDHLEAQLREVQASNGKLLAAQADLELQGRQLSRLVRLSEEIIPLRDEAAILERVMGQLRSDLSLERIHLHQRHGSGAYFRVHTWSGPTPPTESVLPTGHPVVDWISGNTGQGALTGPELRNAAIWDLQLELSWWNPKSQGLLLPLRSRTEDQGLWGFLVTERDGGPFLPFEVELASLHAGILQVSLENASLVAHLAETSKALGTSYEGLESAYEALKEAQRALGAQDRKTALGGLFLNMAQQLQAPVGVLKDESANLSTFMDRPDIPPPEERTECHRSMNQIQSAIAQVDGLVRALLRRAGQGETAVPEWIHLHDLLRQELELMQAEGRFHEGSRFELNLQAPRDLLFGVLSDFVEVLGHLIGHALAGRPGRICLRTWGGQRHFRLEVQDDGPPVDPRLLATAFEPFHDLRSAPMADGRRPGLGLPACAQLMGAYGGILELVPQDQGSLVRLSFPME